MNRVGNPGIRSGKLRVGSRGRRLALGILFAAVFIADRSPAEADSSAEFSALVADRIAIERVYYNHRLDTKPPFEEVLPRQLAEELVRRDLDKERTLKKLHGVEITEADLEAEARRIDSATRAPEVLAELKQALNHDPKRFARTVVRPILVESRLHARFDGDTSLHASQRTLAEQLRDRLLKDGLAEAQPERISQLLKGAGKASNLTWYLEKEPSIPPTTSAILHSTNYSGNATATFGDLNDSIAFSELRPELQTLLKAQLQKPGDLSAVVETDEAFLLFLTRERTARMIRVTLISIPKQNYELWLSRQTTTSAEQSASQ